MGTTYREKLPPTPLELELELVIKKRVTQLVKCKNTSLKIILAMCFSLGSYVRMDQPNEKRL